LTDPFAIDGPAVISFSGGRTSGYMLRRILDVGLREDVHVLFADTGKEREETYDFVRECERRWSVPIHWVHRTAPEGVTPFEQLIVDRRFLPNPVARFCTTELKIVPMRDWMREHRYEHWTNAVGLRADEPRRVAKMRSAWIKDWDNCLPLADAGVTLADIRAFWSAQPFDLRLEPWEGNCDLCFLKGRAKRERIMRDRPDLAGWWIDQERRTGGTFRSDAPPYSTILELSKRPMLAVLNDGPALDDFGDCICNENA